MEICGKIVKDMLADCENPPKGGMEQQVILMNRSDLDEVVKTSSTNDGTHSASFSLTSGTTGFLVTGYANKQLFTYGWSLNVADDQPDDFTHTLSLRLFNCSEDTNSFVNGLALGADIVAVVKSKAGCYEILGLDGGLKITEASKNSNENKAATVFVLSSSGTDTEPKTPYIYFDTDSDTTSANFENKFAAA